MACYFLARCSLLCSTTTYTYQDVLYTKPYSRIAPYAIGLAVGYALRSLSMMQHVLPRVSQFSSLLCAFQARWLRELSPFPCLACGVCITTSIMCALGGLSMRRSLLEVFVNTLSETDTNSANFTSPVCVHSLALSPLSWMSVVW